MGRPSRATHQTRSSVSSIDSDTADFSPSTRTPFKRKASSSSASSSRAFNMGSRAGTSKSGNADLPLIRAVDLFDVASTNESKTVEPKGTSARPINVDEDSSDDGFSFGFELTGNMVTERNADILFSTLEGPRRELAELDILARASEDASKRGALSQHLSAVLVMPDDNSQHGTNSGNGSENVRYLPLCRVPHRNSRQDNPYLTILPSHRDRIQQSDSGSITTRAQWPLYDLPVELFDLITAHLSRDDVKSMRLVSKEFEQKVSRSLFHTSVVPFNTELYDMIDEDQRNLTRTPRIMHRSKGKKKAGLQDQALEGDAGGLMWQNAKEDKEGKVYKGHGLRVFQGFGPHIKRFGMTFEVSEKQLTQPPIKKELENIDSYHGSYDWPSAHYARFANLAGLENTADETSRMKAAFSNLEIVQELALSIDSGLGWLSGPDKSLTHRIFERPSPVFGSKYEVSDRSTAASTQFWRALEESQQSFQTYSTLTEVALEYRPLSASNPSALDGIGQTIYSDSQRWLSIELSKVMPSRAESAQSGLGVLYTTSKSQVSNDYEAMGPSLVPSSLRKEQKEWLLETQWAQQAFLESYMLAVIDNAAKFAKVTNLRIPKLSSRFLPMLSRKQFWNALPCLSDVTLHVSADWRIVEKDNAGLASVKVQNPSEAARIFQRDILAARIANRESIKKLNIGWSGGGEHAQGMHARNSNILPAPVTQLEHSTANSNIFGLVFEFVEHLTLSNCWISPPTLEGLVKSHANKFLKKLTMDSVSLTAHPRFPPANAQGGGAMQFAQAAMAMQGQFANGGQPPHGQQLPAMPQPGQAPGMGLAHQVAQLGPAFLQGANPQQLAALHHQWNQHLQQMQQFFNANPQAAQQQLLNAANGGQQGVNPAQVNHMAAAMAGNQVPAPLHQPALPGPTWIHGHREGSWPQLLDQISPGPVFDDYLPPPKPWEEPLPPRPETNLRAIEFISCGYAKLPNHTGFDQLVMEPDLDHLNHMSPWFRARWTNLKPLMLETRDRHLGQIVQFIRDREMDTLRFGWGLTAGWSDAKMAEEVTFDGQLRGGTGRFSGTIEKGMALIGEPAGLSVA